jgi:HK97 family phage major capsid protein
MTLQELLEKRNKLVADARALNDKAMGEGRDFTAEEISQYDTMFKDINSLNDKIKREQDLAAIETTLAASQGTRAAHLEGVVTDPAQPAGELTPHQRGFRSYLVGSRHIPEAENRALQAGADISGGYIVAPQQFIASLIQAVDNAVFIRQRATKYTVPTAESLGVPSLDTDISDADWTFELLTGNEDSDLAFGKRELRPYPLAKRVKISNKLLRQAALDPEALVRARLAYKFGVTQEKVFMTGTGAQQPLGLFVASALGINTDRDYSTGNTATSITFDGLIGAKYTLKGQYHPKAEWLFHRDAMAQIAKLKDGEGQYIWKENVRVGEPPMLLGLPFMMSEYVPNTFTASLYVGMLADFSFYWIVDALTLQVQRLIELYAATNQTGFIARAELDGMPVLSEAFVRVALSA